MGSLPISISPEEKLLSLPEKTSNTSDYSARGGASPAPSPTYAELYWLDIVQVLCMEPQLLSEHGYSLPQSSLSSYVLPTQTSEMSLALEMEEFLTVEGT